MTPVVGVVGASGSGKTTLIERLVPALEARGLLVGAMKHAPHGFDDERPGSDSWRFARAGAHGVLVAGPDRHALRVMAGPEALAGLVARYFRDVDLILAEGFASEPGPKVLVHRQGVAPQALPPPAEVAVAVTDEPLGYERELTPDDLDSIAEAVSEFARRDRHPRVALLVDGQAVPLTDFVSRLLIGGLHGTLRALRGIPHDPRSIEIAVRVPDRGGATSPLRRWIEHG